MVPLWLVQEVLPGAVVLLFRESIANTQCGSAGAEWRNRFAFTVRHDR